MDGATEQQKLFIDEYLKGRKLNATQAAIVAGYSEKSASSQASQLLKNPRVQKYLEEREVQLHQDLRKEFLFDALEARKVLYEIMNDPNARDRDRIVCARDLLDRAGYKADDTIKLEAPRKSIRETADEIEKYFNSLD